MIAFTLPGTPPSVNALYSYDRLTHEFVLKPEAIVWRRNVHPYIPGAKPELKGKKIKFVMAVHRDWYFKNGAMLKADVSNLEKFVHDTVAKKLGFDDLVIWEKTSRKVQDKDWLGIKIEITTL